MFLFQYLLNTKENKTCKIPMPFLHKQVQGEDRRQQLISFYILILVSIGVQKLIKGLFKFFKSILKGLRRAPIRLIHIGHTY